MLEPQALAGWDQQPCVPADSKRNLLYPLQGLPFLPACGGSCCLPLSLWAAELLSRAAWVFKLREEMPLLTALMEET